MAIGKDTRATVARLVVEQGPHTQFMIGMAEQGWGSSFTKLDVLLAAA